jgi:hypothetical protein
MNTTETQSGSSLDPLGSACAARNILLTGRRCGKPAEWLTPWKNKVCDHHRKVIDRLYRLTNKRCTPLPNDLAEPQPPPNAVEGQHNQER